MYIKNNFINLLLSNSDKYVKKDFGRTNIKNITGR